MINIQKSNPDKSHNDKRKGHGTGTRLSHTSARSHLPTLHGDDSSFVWMEQIQMPLSERELALTESAHVILSAFILKSSDKHTAPYLSSTQQKTGDVSDQIVNI